MIHKNREDAENAIVFFRAAFKKLQQNHGVSVEACDPDAGQSLEAEYFGDDGKIHTLHGSLESS